MDETFFLTNIAPQVGAGFNRHCAFTSRGFYSLLPLLSDWAYLENWCRTLTRSHADVFVFTVPLYLPRKDPDGKWRVVSSTIKRVLSYFYREIV
jgi:endonuclease G